MPARRLSGRVFQQAHLHVSDALADVGGAVPHDAHCRHRIRQLWIRRAVAKQSYQLLVLRRIRSCMKCGRCETTCTRNRWLDSADTACSSKNRRHLPVLQESWLYSARK